MTGISISVPDSGRRYMHNLDYISNFFQGKPTEHWVEFEIPLKIFRGKLPKIYRISINPGRPKGVIKEIRDLRLEW